MQSPSDGVGVDFDKLYNAGLGTKGVAGRIQQQLQDLKGYLAPLTNDWTGEAATEYQAKMASWDRAAQDLHRVLENFAQDLLDAHDNYRGGEKHNTGLWM